MKIQYLYYILLFSLILTNRYPNYSEPLNTSQELENDELFGQLEFYPLAKETVGKDEYVLMIINPEILLKALQGNKQKYFILILDNEGYVCIH